MNDQAKKADNVIYVHFGALNRQRDRRKARALYEAANKIDLDPARMGEAKRLYQQAIKKDPELALAHCNLGAVIIRMVNEDNEDDWEMDMGKAQACFQRAIELEPTMAEAHYNLGHVLLEQGKKTSGRQAFAMAVYLDPTFADAWYNLAVEYTRVAQIDLARRGWKMYLELEPKGKWAQAARRNLLMVGKP